MDNIYLNTAACGLLDKETLRPALDFYDGMLTGASTVSEAYRMEGMQKARQAVAGFINASADNIAFLPNFSFGINSLVQALRGNEKVLLYKHDYPSLLDPFKINNFDITWIDSNDGFDIDMHALQETALKNKVDIIAISQVQWLSGYKLDLAALGSFCREQGIIFLVDATQSLGAIAVDLGTIHCDALIASNYKWMNAGFGNGIMYLSDSFMDKYPPVVGGFGSYTLKDGQFSYASSVRNYEPGHLNIPGLLILEAAISQKTGLGVQHIEQHNAKLTAQLLNGIKDLPLQLLGTHTMENRSSIILAKDENGLYAYLAENGVVISNRMGYIRISMHFYNTADEVDRLITLMNKFYS